MQLNVALEKKDSQWNRQELYERVWQAPLRKLAAGFGISDVALGKICRKLEIPLPGPGHWTKIDCGHTITRPPLPHVKNLPVLLRQTPKQKAPLLPEDSPELDRIERIEASTTPVVTKAMLAHPLIEETKQILSEGRPDNRGVLWVHSEVPRLDIRVSKDTLGRALRIMASVLFALKEEGFEVVVKKCERGMESTSVAIYGEEIRFGLIERSRQIKPPTPPHKGSSLTGYVYNRIELEPTGKLSIEIWNYYSGGLKKVWRDGERSSLEEQLPKCVAGMMRIALRERAEREAREEKKRAEQKQIDEVTEILHRIEAEEKKIKRLEREAAHWKRAQCIREYIAAVREKTVTETDSAEVAKTQEWIRWAEQQADRIDPLAISPCSIVDDKKEVTRRLESFHRFW
jgi:hypothetical protein